MFRIIVLLMTLNFLIPLNNGSVMEDSKTSPDGEYRVLLRDCSGFTIGNRIDFDVILVHGRDILEKETVAFWYGDTPVGKENWSVEWTDNSVNISLTGLYNHNGDEDWVISWQLE